MATAMAEGVKSAHSKALVELRLMHVSQASAADISNADLIALGCPAMGVESLDDSEMSPFIDKIKSLVSGKSIVLFGSYDWGNGAKIIAKNLKINSMPDLAGLAECRSYGNLMHSHVTA